MVKMPHLENDSPTFFGPVQSLLGLTEGPGITSVFCLNFPYLQIRKNLAQSQKNSSSPKKVEPVNYFDLQKDQA